MNFICEKTEKPGVLVIGYGNPLRGDDGVGQRVVDELEKGGLDGINCELCRFAQLLPEHAALVARFDPVFFVDASRVDPPGSVVVSEVFGRFEKGGASHVRSPEGVLNEAKALYGAECRAYVCRIGGRDFRLTESLSPEVRSSVGRAAAEIKKKAYEIIRKKLRR